MGKRFVIFSFDATINDFEHDPLFWSDEDGWVALSTATVFDESEIPDFEYLPDDGKYVLLSEERED